MIKNSKRDALFGFSEQLSNPITVEAVGMAALHGNRGAAPRGPFVALSVFVPIFVICCLFLYSRHVGAGPVVLPPSVSVHDPTRRRWSF